jgi:LytS/YehU family sensor histidine kinase
MELYADLEYIRFEGLFDYVVQIDDDVDTDLPLPPMIVQPLVENAINHGLYNLKNRKGLLEILTSSPKNDEIKIVIRDNGVGRGFQSQSKKPNHKSRGMDILNERISIINSNSDMHVDLNINDLDQTSIKNGTEVTIKIKYFS